jgi:Valyl-tRNA synthetase
MAGGSYKEGVKDMMLPTVWHVKEDYTVEKEIWAHPEDTRQAIITDISADGTTAVGRINLERFDVAYVPIYWPSKTEYVLLDEETAIAGEFTCMSENGEYAGLRAGGAYFFEMETGTQTSVSGDIINGITNNGFAVMASGNALGGSSYVYSKAIGSMSFNAYVNKYLGHLDSEMFEKAKGVSSGNTLLMGISHDGKNLAIHHEDSEIGLMCAYVLHLEDGIEVDAKPRPTGLTTAVNREKRNEVELAWTAPNTQETITGYEIYADNNLRTTVSATDLSYTDTNVPAGRIAYTIVATYDGDMSSAHSDPAVAIVIDNYNIPFADGFESGSIETNYWTAGGWDTSVVTLGFGVEQTVGLGVTISRKNVDFSGTLTSKPLDATGLDKVYLSYMMLANYFDWQSELFTDDTFFVDVSTDGVNWTNVQSYKPERFNDWRAEIVDLSDVVAGKLFNFRFRIEGINKLPNDYKMWLFDYITVDTTGPQGTTVPGDLIFAIEEDDEILRLGWEDPAGLYGLTHSKTFARKAFGNGGANIIAVQAFDKDEISLYQGMSIQSITTTIGNRLVASATPSFKTAVFINGERVDATPVTSFEFGKSNTFLLDEPILITPDITDLKVGIEVVSHHADEWPLTADESYYVVKGKGDLYSENGGTIWKKLSDVVISGDPSRTQSNWIIVANLSKTDNNKARTPFILGYNIYKDDVKLNTDLEHASNYTAPFAEGVYSLRAFSMGTEKLSAQSQGVVVKLVSIDHVGDKSAVAVYPNPASVYVAIDGEYSKVTIFDIKGNAVLVSKPQPQIPVEHLSRGIYVIQVETPKGISSHKLIIK